MPQRQVSETMSHNSEATSLWLHCAASLRSGRRSQLLRQKDGLDDVCLPFGGRSSPSQCLHMSAQSERNSFSSCKRLCITRRSITGYTRVGRTRGAFFRFFHAEISCTWSANVGVVPTFFCSTRFSLGTSPTFLNEFCTVIYAAWNLREKCDGFSGLIIRPFQRKLENFCIYSST